MNDHWSVEGGITYSYWHYDSRQEFQGLTGYRLEPRYRLAFPNDRFGAYLGLYGRYGDYDSMTMDNSQMTNDNSNTNAQPSPSPSERAGVRLNYTGRYWDAGLSAGFTVRLVGGLGLEVGARAGYVRTNAIRYIRKDDRNLFDGRQPYSKVRVTDMNVSLTWRIGK
jgi:hypothetical protein